MSAVCEGTCVGECECERWECECCGAWEICTEDEMYEAGWDADAVLCPCCVEGKCEKCAKEARHPHHELIRKLLEEMKNTPGKENNRFIMAVVYANLKGSFATNRTNDYIKNYRKINKTLGYEETTEEIKHIKEMCLQTKKHQRHIIIFEPKGVTEYSLLPADY